MAEDVYDLMGAAPAEPRPPAGGPPRPFDRREWAERKRQERQETFARADAAALRANSDPEALESYLRVAAALPHHSASNVLLIADRMPGATRVGTAEYWREQGASIRRGQKAIPIIEPSKEYTRDDGTVGTLYDVRKVFDVSQTTMRPSLPRKADLHAALTSLVSRPPARIEPVDDLGGRDAEYDHAAGLIRVQRGLDERRLLSALSVEFAHAWMARGADEYDRDGSAAKADLAAGIVARRLHLDAPGAVAPPAPPGSDARRIRQALEEVNGAARDVAGRAMPRERARADRGDAR